MNAQPNARFMVWANGDNVPITLRPGQSLSWSGGGPCDEGYSNTGFTAELDASTGIVYLENWYDARDCDGRVTSERRLQCHVMRLKASKNGYGHPFPDWQDVDHSQRDYSAEAAGY